MKFIQKLYCLECMKLLGSRESELSPEDEKLIKDEGTKALIAQVKKTGVMETYISREQMSYYPVECNCKEE